MLNVPACDASVAEGECSLAQESQERDEQMPAPGPPSREGNRRERRERRGPTGALQGAPATSATSAVNFPAETPREGGAGIGDDEFLRCLRCGDTGILSYLLRRGRGEPRRAWLRCFCALGEAADPSLPRVDDVFPPQRRRNLKIEAWLGRLCTPGGFSPLVLNADDDTPEDAPPGNGRTC